MDNQTYISLYFVVLLWVLSSFYTLKWHHKRGDEFSLGIIVISFLLGPILAIFVRNNEKETEEKNIREHIQNDEFQRWFETNDLINQVRRPNPPTWTRWGRITIPPPPPISQTKKENKLKDFKFLRDK